MPRQSYQQRMLTVWENARKEFDRSVSATEDQREQSLEDRRFCSVYGAQWEGLFGDQFENKPRLEMNKVNMAKYRVINEWRSNRITVSFVNKDGSEDKSLSDVCDGLFRADEQDSRATEAYDMAFEEMVAGGYGAWRLTAEYEDEYDPEDDRQRIRMEPIPDADSTVYWDPQSKLYDKSDAGFCFVLTGYTREAYIDEFNDFPEDWGRPITDVEFDWWDGDDYIYVAEYFRVEDESYKVYRYRTIAGEIEFYEADALTEEMEQELSDIGTIRIGEKRVKRQRVHKYIMSGGGILEDCGLIAGSYIPIIPCYGKREFIDGRERWAGVARYVKDAQRLYNMQVSYLAEIAARGGYRKPIFAPEQVAGFESYWADDAVDNRAYMLINPIMSEQGEQFTGPLGYTEPPEMPPSMASLIQLVDKDILDLLGRQEAGEEVDTQLSGKAVELIQNRLDMQAHIYMSNFAKSMRRAGEIWLDMAAELYSEEGRAMKSVGAQNEIEMVRMNDRSIFDESGEIVMENDLSRAKMDVTADVGPSSSSKRSALVRSVTAMMPLVADPTDQKVLSVIALMNMEGEGLSEYQDYFRRQLVQMGVLEPTEQEQIEMAEAQQAAQEPTPEQQFYLSEAQKNQAEAQKAEAQTIETIAKAEKAKAETAETLASIENSQRDSVVRSVEALSRAGTTPPANGVRQ